MKGKVVLKSESEGDQGEDIHKPVISHLHAV